MKKTIVLLFLIAAIFFIAGYIFCFISGLIAEGDRGDEYRRIEELKKEASSFFYKTMRELYEGTYNPEDGYVSQSAYESFKEYKSKLEPKCHLAQINEAYGTFYGYAFFPSEDVFIIEMKRFEEKWRLITLDRVNTQSFWRDLKVNKDKEKNSKLLRVYTRSIAASGFARPTSSDNFIYGFSPVELRRIIKNN